MSKIPSDNYIRKMLDEADPELLQPCFNRVQSLLAEPALKKAFQRLDGRTLIALDGTECFCSQTISCANCLHRKRSNGKIEHYHSFLSATVVSPGHNSVMPLMPEFIAPQDGAEKQDCERNAVKRWFKKHGEHVKALNPVYLGDDLFACQPVTTQLKEGGADFIFTCKESSHKVLYDFINGADSSFHETRVQGRILRYRWIENVPLRDGEDAITVNWIGFQILDTKNRIKYNMAWVTSLPISQNNIAEVVACARARWKIENEGFNVMKNHGYELEHNFGHGKRFLAMTMVAFNLLAFAWHSILDILEPPWIAAREAAGKRARFFTNIVTLSAFVLFPSWKIFLKSIATFQIPPDLIQTQKK